jgi:hypothetical protein
MELYSSNCSRFLRTSNIIINILIAIDIFYKEHVIIVMIMLGMFILGDRFIKVIIACF